MALTPEQLSQLQQFWANARSNATGTLNLGGNTYSTMGLETNDEGGHSYAPNVLMRQIPGNTDFYYAVDPQTGQETLTPWNHGGSWGSSLLKDIGTPAAMFAAMYAGGQGLGALMGAGGSAGAAGTTAAAFNPAVDSQLANAALGSDAFAGYGIGAGAGAAGAGAGTAGEVLSKAALDGTTAFGANSVPGAFDLSSMAGSALAPSVSGVTPSINPNGFSLSSLLGGGNPLSTMSLLNGAGSLVGALAANKAANTQAQAGNTALNLQRDMFNTQVGLEAPFRQAGVDTSGKLSYLLGVGPNNPAYASSAGGYGSMLKPFGMEDFQLDPGIQFQIQQGNQALQNSQAAKDGVLSGAAMKELIGFNQGMAGTGYQSAYDRYMNNRQFQYDSLMGPTQIGQAAASGTAANAGTMGRAMSDTITGIGNARAGGTVGTANAISGGLGNIGNAYFLSQFLKNPMSMQTTTSYA